MVSHEPGQGFALLDEDHQLLEGRLLDLADALAREVERPPDLVERERPLVVEPVAQFEHAPLAVGERLHRLVQGLRPLFLQAAQERDARRHARVIEPLLWGGHAAFSLCSQLAKCARHIGVPSSTA